MCTTKIYTTYLAPFVQKAGYEAGTGIVKLFSKASNTGFSRHIKTGCYLPVCITIKKTLACYSKKNVKIELDVIVSRIM